MGTWTGPPSHSLRLSQDPRSLCFPPQLTDPCGLRSSLPPTSLPASPPLCWSVPQSIQLGAQQGSLLGLWVSCPSTCPALRPPGDQLHAQWPCPSTALKGSVTFQHTHAETHSPTPRPTGTGVLHPRPPSAWEAGFPNILGPCASGLSHGALAYRRLEERTAGCGPPPFGQNFCWKMLSLCPAASLLSMSYQLLSLPTPWHRPSSLRPGYCADSCFLLTPDGCPPDSSGPHHYPGASPTAARTRGPHKRAAPGLRSHSGLCTDCSLCLKHPSLPAAIILKHQAAYSFSGVYLFKKSSLIFFH